MTDKVPKLLVDALGAIDSVDDEIVYLTAIDDLHSLKTDLAALLAQRG